MNSIDFYSSFTDYRFDFGPSIFVLLDFLLLIIYDLRLLLWKIPNRIYNSNLVAYAKLIVYFFGYKLL